MTLQFGFIIGLSALLLIILIVIILMNDRTKQLFSQRESVEKLLQEQQTAQQTARQQFDQYQIQSLKLIQDSMQNALSEMRNQVASMLNQNTQRLTEQVDKLTQATQEKLKEISQEVNKQLTVGFEKTNSTFHDVVKRLAIIDEAQKKITELSSNVVGLQDILSDKKSRGAFGEIQLSGLLHNMLPETHFALQHTLSNGKRVDCLLFLPEPTGNIAIDSKFPLESYRKLQNKQLTDAEKKSTETQFKIDIKKHIQDVAEKYIIPGETADGAMLFIPAEAIFAEIHGKFEELVEFAQQKRVWLVSPTTMMAILTTARAVLKDAATRQQVHIIQEHLIGLGKDFERFQKRMDDLAKHMNQAHQDVELVHKSSQKLTSRFQKIEKVDVSTQKINLLETEPVKTDD
ncbi:MAG: DNA recombination protein RmuC [Gammaproteobacteria bacterium CG_4_10_14_0_8_um_filter_38_16]|nr:MAG: DNA recombination protein RmuC [Gammaproteobacteria bacterium CG_4_10_14_0_8_um_filter_38_16]PJA03387.1 MAG: DNA recombination protein RmuC [Gammaproteobacteria bacterium CG_4_10_14_0_2_um_filter_38_22]PJB11125.1 MAG: DNA recombination protein RmuC [Gammaproteobacteria bacterium CG_4_9_14_3_um_filter_38_9]